MKTSAYGYKVDQEVLTRVPLKDENGGTVPAGSRLRLVAIAPKVRIVTRNPCQDTRAYFYNAVRSTQAEDYGDRIRADFCTIRHA